MGVAWIYSLGEERLVVHEVLGHFATKSEGETFVSSEKPLLSNKGITSR